MSPQKKSTRRKKAVAKSSSRTFRSGVHAFALSFSIGLAAIGYSVSPWESRTVTTGTSEPSPRPATGAGFAGCLEHFPATPPAVAAPGAQRELCFDAFAVLYSGESKTPVYSVERLTRSSLESARGIQRSDKFYPEARLPAAYRAQLADYAGSGYDRGHMAPAGDMPTAEAKAQSFSLANMVPQAPALNQKAWNQIEQATRKYVARASGSVYVFTGPHYGAAPATLGHNRVWVPAATWKLVHVPAEGRSWAYWMGNDAGPHSLTPIDYAQFVKRGGPALLAGKLTR